VEVDYYKNGGILQTVLKNMLVEKAQPTTLRENNSSTTAR
jgi:hypothetical protein